MRISDWSSGVCSSDLGLRESSLNRLSSFGLLRVGRQRSTAEGPRVERIFESGFAIQLARRRDGTSIERHETTACEPPAIAGSDQPVLIDAEAAGQILLVAEPQLLGQIGRAHV